MSLDSVSNVIISLISGFFGGYISNYYRERTRARREHFEDIKSKVLEPIYKYLGYVPSIFCFVQEDSSIIEDIDSFVNAKINHMKEYSIRQNVLNQPAYSNENLSFDYSLYDDLKNHFPDLTKTYGELEQEIREHGPKFFQSFKETYELIRNGIIAELERIGISLVNTNREEYIRLLRYSINATIFKIEGIDESYWPKAYNFLKEKSDYLAEFSKGVGKSITTPLEIVMKISNDLKGNDSVKKYLETKKTILPSISDAKEKTQRWINHKGKLPGSCKYL
jgi:hypothetical protein